MSSVSRRILASRHPAGVTSSASASTPRWARRPAARLVRDCLGVAWRTLFRGYFAQEVRGTEHLAPLAGPVIFIANHTSHLDTPALLAALPARWRRRMAADRSATRRRHQERRRATGVHTGSLAVGFFLCTEGCELFQVMIDEREGAFRSASCDLYGSKSMNGSCERRHNSVRAFPFCQMIHRIIYSRPGGHISYLADDRHLTIDHPFVSALIGPGTFIY